MVKKEKQGTANAMYFSFMDIGIAVGSTGLGILAAITGYHVMYRFSIICLAALLFIYTLKLAKSSPHKDVVQEAS